jgi:hypothetical protein
MRLLPPPPPEEQSEPGALFSCTTCEYDLHLCPGCGCSIQHGIELCMRCRNEEKP